MISILGLQWHLYGLLLGVSIWLGWELVAHQARRQNISLTGLQNAFPWVILGGIGGARLYHVMTDWRLYVSHPWEALYLWRGGLSIIGAVIGGGLVLAVILKRSHRLGKLPWYLDLSVFGLPLAQALGRIGNYINHELYGRPSTLPWAITIEPQYRLPQYQSFATYHPLFAYEMLALLLYGLIVWWLARRRISPRLGTGMWFASYIAYYSIIRFMLDFLRIDTQYLVGTPFTINQIVMVVTLCGSLIFIKKNLTQAQT